MKLDNVNIVLEDTVVFGCIEFDNIIKKIHAKSAYKSGFPILTPGFIDGHIHGAASYDVLDGTIEAIEAMAKAIVQEGTTSFLPTPMTSHDSVIINSLKSIHAYSLKPHPQAAQVVGIHLEGPFINVDARGAQPLAHIKSPDIDTFKMYQDASHNLIKKVSLAPELPGSMALIDYLVGQQIIPSIAHTKATYEIALKAYNSGATSLTHTYNAMTPIHHRDIGVVGLGYTQAVMCELIYDKIHVSPPAADLLIKNATVDRVMLITDSMRNKGLGDGISELGGQKVIVKAGQARLENGSLAGSVLTMIDGYNHLRELGHDYVDLAKMTASNTAKHYHLNDRGIIKEGFKSDFVLLSPTHDILTTYIGGKAVYSKKY